MNIDVIELANEIEKLQMKAAMELCNSWMIERLMLTNSIALYLLGKGDKEEAMAWMEGLLDWTDEDFLSEVEENASDLNSWFSNRTKDEISYHSALEIIHSETPSVEKIKKLLEEAAKKLAEYENMEPVAWMCQLRGSIFYTDSASTADRWSNNKDANIVPLYRHPNK
ncbi:hypothetical protein [Xenorhabdus miraniensis]|uniref:Uncharacterized protein n=1 Tax=Xenorhabdus miraniensis TaxID=351674 RepID=A0A2D0JJS5_9GAMM|nr:hypothetical protein [Xenorhabdus miraniensis]PHM46548.1 hypothetical protein Xmir_04113 [Xenorhabdus miraniensis]